MIDITSYVNGYSSSGDIIVMVIVIVMAILIRVTYIIQSKEFKVFKVILLCILIAAVSNILFNQSLKNIDEHSEIIVYLLKYINHFSVSLVLALYLFYIKSQMKLSESVGRKIDYLAVGFFSIFVCVDLLGMIFGFGFNVINHENIQTGRLITLSGYLSLASMIVYVLIRYGKHMYRPVVKAFYAILLISLVVTFNQVRYFQRSFTMATLIFPAIAIMYLVHSNPYDLETGSLHADSFNENIESAIKKKEKLLVFFLHLINLENKQYKYPKEIRDKIREHCTYTFKGAKLFLLGEGKMALSVRIDLNPDYEAKANKLLDVFQKEYETYRYDYKIVILKDFEGIDKYEDYIRLTEYVENRMSHNEMHYINADDIEKYSSHRYIVKQLEDINKRKDLHDPRVLVYCQPILNLETGKYDTAEALMRLRLDKVGMVFPDRFIPIAEKHNYIHMLSLIIFSKTCNDIRRLMDDGYIFKRISVNFSMLDIKEENFCESITKIIRNERIPFDKVAIEITESQNEKDFITLKEKLFELRESGITFYLDDFGTGYSNMERIMELPFDIIKFDRSLVIASGTDDKSKTMVTYMAHMFKDMNYDILYEGVEDDTDQIRCEGMYAKYLQGYKYSKPIPIDQLSEFLEKGKND